MNVDDLIDQLEDLCGDLKTPTQQNSKSLKTQTPTSQPFSYSKNLQSSSLNPTSFDTFSSQTFSTYNNQSQNENKQNNQQQNLKQKEISSSNQEGLVYFLERESQQYVSFDNDKGEIEDLLSILEKEDYSVTGKSANSQKIANTAQGNPNKQKQTQQNIFPLFGLLFVIRKCITPYLWSKDDMYAADEFNMKKRVCNALRCQLCNIVITKIENCKWSDDADLMHFRNNFSRRDKLLERAINDYGYSAYSCQCKGISVSKLGTLQEYGIKEWKCTGHSD